ncbi:cocaine esterase isoform X2 [Osmerus eperlanus]
MCIQNRQLSIDLAAALSLKVEIPDVSEDCLYLNIYVPAKASEKAKLPVMFWIHGGGFSMGAASMYDGSVLAAYQDVVVVMVQYRLGLLGFLSTGDHHIPGNMGLMDQVEGLRWVQEHIHNFGGDPGAVTIFGESAGGMSVSLLLLSPMSTGLFHRAIAQSGTAVMDGLHSSNPLPMAKMAANSSGCDITSTEKIAECMKVIGKEALLTIAEDPMMRFAVTVDGHFLPKPAEELFQNQQLHKVPFMTGINTDEGGWLLPGFFAPPNWIEGMDREEVLAFLSLIFPDPKDHWKAELVTDEYLGTSGDRVKIRNGFTQLIGDFLFNIPAIKTANSHRDAGVPMYVYELQEPPTILTKLRPSFVGVDHADDLIYVFGFCFVKALEGRCIEEDERLSLTIMKYWGNFAHTGDPNGAGLSQWPQYGAEGDYLGIGLEQVAGQHLRRERFIFHTQTLPEKIRQVKEKMSKDSPVVQTKLGGLRGQYVEVKGKETLVHAYLGVPFAKPPVGPLRLAPPQPTDGWEGLRDATKQPFMCLQDKDVMVNLISKMSSMTMEFPEISEDCLYLNIYTPAKPAQDAKLPVMVWIHGGGFTMGSASMFDGSALAAYQDVVVVMVQYRLGLLGFLSTGDHHIPGNMGLMDQVEGLRWVQEHIHNFGGDPGAVTIFGESAGGMSVSLLLLSPMSTGLFHGAIAESGTAAMDALLTLDPLLIAKMAANSSGCDITSTKKIAECMRAVGEEDILTLAKDQTMRFLVTVDGHFLIKPVEELFQNQQLHKVPFMTGITSDEGGWLLPGFLAPPNWTEGMDRGEVLPFLSVIFPDPKDHWIAELVADEYLGTSGDRVKIRNGFTQLIGDFLFNIPAIKTANAHTDAGAAVYLYEYRYIPTFIADTRPSFVGSDHGEEIFTVFGLCFTTTHVKLSSPCTKEDEHLCKTMMGYWGNFARTGDPNGAGLSQWPQYGAEGDYLGIGLEQVAGQHLRRERLIFLTQTLPEKIRQSKEEKEHREL